MGYKKPSYAITDELNTFTERQTFDDNIFTTGSSGLYLASGLLQFVHNTNDANINVFTGDFVITNQDDDTDIIFRTDNGSGSITEYIKAQGSTGSVILSHYGTEKLATKSDGIEVSGVVDLSSATNGFVLGDKATSNKILYASTENAFTLIKSDNTFAGVRASDLLLSPVTFANLPSGGALTTGLIAVINDAGTVTYRGTASGGGSNVAMVMYDGTNWIYH